MKSLRKEQIEEIKENGNIDIVQESFRTQTSKYLFKTKLDKVLFEMKNLNKIKKELKEEKEIESNIDKERKQHIKKISRLITNRVDELKEIKKRLLNDER